jgi:hypothetical protein
MNIHRNLFFVILAALILFACNFSSAPVSLPGNLPAPLSQIFESSPTPELATPEPTLKVSCPSGNCANACIDKLNTFLQSSGKPGSPPHASVAHFGSQDNQTVMVTYQIDGDVIKSPQLADHLPAALIPYQQDTATQGKIWKYFTTIIPLDQRKDLAEFIIFTDGKGGILASVGQASNDPKIWVLNVDIVDAGSPRELTYTLLHEFGHLLTLNSKQVTPDLEVMSNPNDQQIYQKAAAACPQFMASNGCTQPNSYMNLFFQKFWPKIYAQWNKINAEKDQNNYLALLGQFYFTYQSQFVSDYSVVSPEEDLAESWARFALGPRPTGKSIANQKVLFFYDFPELVDLRTRIANGICNYAELK